MLGKQKMLLNLRLLQRGQIVGAAQAQIKYAVTSLPFPEYSSL